MSLSQMILLLLIMSSVNKVLYELKEDKFYLFAYKLLIIIACVATVFYFAAM